MDNTMVITEQPTDTSYIDVELLKKIGKHYNLKMTNYYDLETDIRLSTGLSPEEAKRVFLETFVFDVGGAMFGGCDKMVKRMGHTKAPSVKEVYAYIINHWNGGK